MHKPLLVSLSSGASPGHLAQVAKALGDAKPPINIGGIGGAEWENRGAVVLLFDDNDDDGVRDRAQAIIEAPPLNYQTRRIEAVTVELPNTAGTLGEAAGLLGDESINVEAIIVVGSRGPNALVSFGVAEGDLDAARRALGRYPQLAP
jgi:hypothetical protein